jgi:hypothetical protein
MNAPLASYFRLMIIGAVGGERHASTLIITVPEEHCEQGSHTE